MIPGRWGLLLAAVAGGLLSLAFPPVGFGPYAAAVIGLLAAVQFRRSIRFGLLSGLIAGSVFFLLLLVWLQEIGMDAWVMASLYCALWLALLGAGTAIVTRLPLWPVWVAALWVLQEALRGSAPILAFTWGRIAFGQPDSPFGRVAAILGQPGVTFVTALAGCAVVAAVLRWRSGTPRAGWIWLGTAAAVTVASALVPLRPPAGGSTMTVAIVQGGTPQTGMGALDVRRQVLDNHATRTAELTERIAQGIDAQPAFVLWPENSSDIDPLVDAQAARTISAAADGIGAPILVGAVMRAPSDDGLWNVGLMWEPGSGPTEMYVKRHLVPFGEYVPFRELIAPHVDRLDRVSSDFLPGDRAGLFTIDGTVFGDVICFEVAYDDVIHPILDSPARFITVQTNNATFAGSAQPEQQLGISRMRAIEGGRPVLIAATTGVSAVIDPDGVVVRDIGEGEVGSLVVQVPLDGTRTPATVLGDLPEIVLSLLGFGALLWGALAMLRGRRPRGDRAAAPRVET